MSIQENSMKVPLIARRAALALACASLPLGALFSAPAQAQAYPSKLIRVIVPYAPGGSSDNVARLINQKMQENWGQTVLIDHKPGGNTIIGTEALTKAAPDGYTLLIVLNTHSINPLLTTLPYDPIKDFAPITTVGVSEYMLAVNPAMPGTLKEIIAQAKAKPGQLNYSTSGAGGLGHLAGELFNTVAGVKTMHIPYKGGAPSVQALVAGQVQLAFVPPINVIQLIKGSKLRAVAISGKSRLASLPDMPTFEEAGLPGLKVSNWYGMLAPTGTPRDILMKLNGEYNRIQGLADVKEKLQAQGIDPFPQTPEQFGAMIKSDMDTFAKLVKSANIKLEN
jgi:tripartite-type tricarboxylate transporter receptor subunit TctC